MDVDNESYLKQRKVPLEGTAYQELLKVLDAYGTNRWWLSANPCTRAYYQTVDQSGSLVLPYRQYLDDLRVLLGREVQLYEIRTSNRMILRQEAEQAWNIKLPL